MRCVNLQGTAMLFSYIKIAPKSSSIQDDNQYVVKLI